SAKDTGANVGAVALLLEELDGPAAEEMYRRYAAEAKRPEALLVLAAYLGRQGRTDEALELCEQAWKTCRPQAVAAGRVAILDAGTGTAGQCERIERWLTAALAKEPDASALRIELANLRHLQGRYAEAESLYRQVLSRPDAPPEAMNNLAWLLAFQDGHG